MEKKFKPVPDVEALRYKGTPEKPDIKIFVSHRIDLDSETIDNPMYIPVRCGAVYDTREGVTMLGDDTGDNISDRRESFCELTVQYWAWKNVEADYYGLCHYRRYLSFSNQKFENTDDFNHIIEPVYSKESIEKYGLDEDSVAQVVKGYDIISLKPLHLDHLPHQKAITVYESLKKNDTVFPIEAIDKLIHIFKQKYPQYSKDVDNYFGGYTWRGFNCYILKKHYFNEYNELLFDLLFALEKELPMWRYNQEQYRVVGYMAEAIFAIYYNHLQKSSAVRTCEQPLVRFENIAKQVKLLPAFSQSNIPILVASSNEYVSFLSTLLISIRENASKDYNYDIIVISSNIRQTNKKIITQLFSDYKNFSLRFVDADQYLSGRHFYTAMHITPITYLRLAMLDILEYYDKALYLDCDVIVCGDISELFHTNVEDSYLAAAVDTVMAGWCNVKDNPQLAYNRDMLGLKSEFTYFNAGIILVNLKEFRKNYTTKKLMDIAASKNWKWFDQDVLNMVCQGKVTILDNEWNVMAHLHDNPYQLAEFFAPLKIYKRYLEVLNAPKAIHYAGRFIPCFVPQVDLAEYFWTYARMSPYYELILSAMMSNQIGLALHPELDGRSGARRLADKVLPKGSKRREFAKVLLPKGSLRWRFCKQIYYIFKPQYRPVK